jgi:hypothetical protein
MTIPLLLELPLLPVVPLLPLVPVEPLLPLGGLGLPGSSSPPDEDFTGEVASSPEHAQSPKPNAKAANPKRNEEAEEEILITSA